MKIDARNYVLLIVGGSAVFMTVFFIFLQSLPNGGVPKLDNRLAIDMIKSYYLTKGVDLEKLSSNYIDIGDNETGLFSYVYRQRYDGEKFIVRIYYKPADIYLSECIIKENKVLGCLSTEEGKEFIQKYS